MVAAIPYVNFYVKILVQHGARQRGKAGVKMMKMGALITVGFMFTGSNVSEMIRHGGRTLADLAKNGTFAP